MAIITPEAAAAAITDYLTDLGERAVAAGYVPPDGEARVHLSAFGDGTCSIMVGARRFGRFDATPEEAIAAVETFLARDELADLNATLGLGADGLYVVSGELREAA